MESKPRSNDVERKGLTNDAATEDAITEEVVNDSLGTVDIADSTGLDSEKEAEATEVEREFPDTTSARTESPK